MASVTSSLWGSLAQQLGIFAVVFLLLGCDSSSKEEIKSGPSPKNPPNNKLELALLNTHFHTQVTLLNLAQVHELISMVSSDNWPQNLHPCIRAEGFNGTELDGQMQLYYLPRACRFKGGKKKRDAFSLQGQEILTWKKDSQGNLQTLSLAPVQPLTLIFQNKNNSRTEATWSREFLLERASHSDQLELKFKNFKFKLDIHGEKEDSKRRLNREWTISENEMALVKRDGQWQIQKGFVIMEFSRKYTKAAESNADLILEAQGPLPFSTCHWPLGSWQAQYQWDEEDQTASGVLTSSEDGITSTLSKSQTPWVNCKGQPMSIVNNILKSFLRMDVKK